LMWQAWEAPFDGIEWLNPDTSWRMRLQESWQSRLSVLAALATYVVRPPETMARLLGGTGLDASRWHAVARARRVVILAGADAHANLALGSSDPVDTGFSLPLPGYETSFRTMSTHAQIEKALTGDPGTDARLVIDALRSGHPYIAIDGLATPPAFEFNATNGHETAKQGDELALSGAVTLHVRSNAPSSYSTLVWRGSQAFASFRGKPEFTQAVDQA